MDIEVAKFRLYNRNPFFGTLLFNTPVEESEETPTAAVDGEKLMVNKKFWGSLTNKEKVGILAHEVSHLALRHLTRGLSRRDTIIVDSSGNVVMLWNVACDYAINPLIVDSLGSDFLPKNACLDSKYNGWSAEQIYDDLVKRTKKMSKDDIKAMVSGMIGDDRFWGKASGKNKEKYEQKMKQIFNQAKEAQKRRGSEDGLFGRLFKSMEPKEDWRRILIDYAQPYNDDYNMHVPDRRFLDEDFMLPDIVDAGEQIDWVAVAIDTSGSVGADELSKFISELKGIMSSFERVSVKLTFCDTDATPFTELLNFGEDKGKIKPQGGGGTDFNPVFKLIEKQENAPKALLYFTDMMGLFPNKAPDYDVIWINSYQDTKPPFGRVVKYKV